MAKKTARVCLFADPDGDRYQPFSEVTRDALLYALKASGLTATEAEQQRLLEAWYHPVPFPDVRPLLQGLQAERRVILSNGDSTMLQMGLMHSGLDVLVDGVLNVDQSGRFKPHPDAYQLVIDRFGVDRDEVVFVSSNGWDVAGAAHFGFRVIWVNRGGAPLEQLSVKPWKMVSSLSEIAPAATE
ncbi:MAG: haloacid dehalogenase type II [Firmicutes bacterium]|nr:haloacid dehalogenase type II [Bacillota bacterium]